MNEMNQQGSSAPGIVERAKAVLMSPKNEWPKIAGETDSVRDIFFRYAVPLAAIGPVAGFLGGQLFGYGAFGFHYRPSLLGGLSTAITAYVLGLASIFLVSWIASFIASKFDGQEDFARAFRLCAYSFTAAWVAAIVRLVPSLSILSLLGLYSLYLFYLGATPMISVPQAKAAGYTAITVVAAIVIYLIVGALAATITGGFGMAGAISSANEGSGKVEMNLPGYGKLKVEDNGDKQTMELPGVGKVEVTRDGKTVKIKGDNINAEVNDPDAGN